ncbi:MAG: alpha/beta fold hydrolase [Rhodospirillales bacterium]|nr:alpha/beta fold hydrolase [Rhodospirillales bacterium]
MSEQFIPVGIGQRLFSRYTVAPHTATKDPADKTLAILAHGFPGGHIECHGHIFADLENICHNRKIDTLCFDFRGCGDSDGQSEDFTLTAARQDFQTVLNWAKKQGYHKFFYIGEGLGAAIALMNADENLKGLVMLWPLLDFRKTVFRDFFDAVQTPVSRQNQSITMEGYKVGLPLLNELLTTTIAPFLEKIRAPILIQHGDADTAAPITQLDLLRRHTQKSRRVDITSYEKGEHGLPLIGERRMIFHHVEQFLKTYS